jgi:catechol-2,3-dioxygenase
MAALNFAESLDHFVVPVDDLIAAEEFYVRVLGGIITKRNGLNVRQRKRGAVPHTFIQIGGKRMGIYLQSEERPLPKGSRGLPTYSFTTTPEGLEKTMTELRELDAEFDGPVANSHGFAEHTIFLIDPAGNHYAVYTPRPSSSKKPPANSQMTGVGYMELEAPDVRASSDFYTQVLGFELLSQSATQALLTMPSGQDLILTQAPFSSKGLVMSRKVPGPHIAFYIPAAKWQAALSHLKNSESKTAIAAPPKNATRARAERTWTIRRAT